MLIKLPASEWYSGQWINPAFVVGVRIVQREKWTVFFDGIHSSIATVDCDTQEAATEFAEVYVATTNKWERQTNVNKTT